MGTKKHNRTITPADLAAAAALKKIWLREKRKRRLNQVGAAAELGLTQGAFSQYINGKLALGIGATLKFARLLSCRPTDIRPDFEGLVNTTLTPEALEIAFAWQEIPDANYRTYFKKLIAGWSDRKVG